MRHAMLLAAALIVIALQGSQPAVASLDVEIDASCRVLRVIDGDTFRCVVVGVYNEDLGVVEGVEYRVRLADINAPELRPRPEPGAVEATEALRSLVSGRLVYLDIDDLQVFDRYGRIIALVLAPYNETHAVNVNKLLVVEGHAYIWEHENEWALESTSLYYPLTLYEAREDGVEPATTEPVARGLGILVAVVIAIAVIVLVLLRRLL